MNLSNTAAEKIANYLLQINAIKLKPNEPFTWASGWKSPIYCDNRISLSHVEVRNFIKIELAKLVQDNFKNIDAIIAESDGLMVARGDLGVEVPMQRVPLIQKTIVEKCLAAAKPCIIATQMMESMIVDSMPTRAEINDVANAVLDGADALMLSAETSVGKHPLRVIEIMSSIITDVESDRRTYYKGVKPTNDSPTFASDEICFTALKLFHLRPQLHHMG